VVERVRVHARTRRRRGHGPAFGVPAWRAPRPPRPPRPWPKLGWADLAARAEAITDPAKVRLLVRNWAEHTANGEKVLVFTAFRKTLDTVAESVRAAGIDAAVYDGGLSRAEKERVIGAFRDDVPGAAVHRVRGGRPQPAVLPRDDQPRSAVESDADRTTPWPVHRVGQNHDVLLTNLVSKGSIEERILYVLESKDQHVRAGRRRT
jgi:SNF2 family DNA or RNA helicase